MCLRRCRGYLAAALTCLGLGNEGFMIGVVFKVRLTTGQAGGLEGVMRYQDGYRYRYR